MKLRSAMLRFFLAPILSLCALNTFARTVQVRAAGNDVVGEQLILHVRERFAKSPGFELTDDPKADRFVVNIHTADPKWPCDPERQVTIYSIVWYGEIHGTQLYLDSSVGGTSPANLDDTADQIVARTDHLCRLWLKRLRRSEPAVSYLKSSAAQLAARADFGPPIC